MSDSENLDLDRLERVAKAATPGPWEQDEHWAWQNVVNTPLLFISRCSITEDAKHIAAFDPPTCLALIERVRCYRGNSPGHWWAKAKAYGGIVHACVPALEAAGHPIDRRGETATTIAAAVESLVAERDEAKRRAAAFEAAAEELEQYLDDSDPCWLGSKSGKQIALSLKAARGLKE